VTVDNVAPVVDVGPDQASVEGEAVSFDATFTDLGPVDTHTIVWDFGDGTTISGTLAPVHVYADDGDYTVTLTVTDDDGGVGVDTLLVVVANAAPIVEAGPDQIAYVGETAHFAGTFSDAGVEDTHTLVWDFGDGQTVAEILTPTHIYTQSGLYIVTLTVTDDDGGAASDTLSVTVHSSVPFVEAGPDQVVDEGSVVSFAGSSTGGGPFTYEFAWDFGDGVWATGSLTPTHVYADDPPGGVYTVTLTVSSEWGSASDTLRVTVANVAPVVEAGSDQVVVDGTSVGLGGSFTDAGVFDTHSIVWDLGDGGTAIGTLAPTHTYASAGVYIVTLTVTDDDGGVGTDTLVVTVTPQPTSCELYPIALHQDTLEGVAVGEELPDVLNGAGQGNFGWLTWTGANGMPVLEASLTVPGNSETYVNVNDPADHVLSVGDWVQGRPGVANSRGVRDALDGLKPVVITVPVWDVATGQGGNTQYHIVGFARIQIVDYRLPGQDRISAIFLGYVDCSQ
jgi:PKD repeat protein